MKKKNEWELKGKSYQIADTGCTDGHYELSNGSITLITKDDIDENDQIDLCEILNEMDCNWYCEETDKSQYELYLEKDKNEKIKKFMKDIGINDLIIDKVEHVGADEVDILVAIEQIKKNNGTK